tara:strand:- start:54 stop:341 length:288 start_codon:yes stop_codon:yes gene_type:complete
MSYAAIPTNPETGLPYNSMEEFRQARLRWRMANDECADPLTGELLENWRECDAARTMRLNEERIRDFTARSRNGFDEKSAAILAVVAGIYWFWLR